MLYSLSETVLLQVSNRDCTILVYIRSHAPNLWLICKVDILALESVNMIFPHRKPKGKNALVNLTLGNDVQHN